ncbi:MAG: thiamine phosphate synthase [Candidatus Lindowbacteria bacterium]|nr:thiamine phosphate synthase [Candidatus Lindowbacteria bacterium]
MVRVYPIIEPEDCLESPEVCEALVKSGIAFLQIRGSGNSGEEVIRTAVSKMRALCSKHKVELIVNDAAALAADENVGVHLGQSDLALNEARQLLKEGQCIGISTHSEDEARNALSADYIAVGPIYPTQSKADAHEVVGTEMIKKVKMLISNSSAHSTPLVAIGGINQENYRACIESGADYVASISVFRDAVTGRLRPDASDIAVAFQ